MKLNAVDERLLKEVAQLHTVPSGAYNIRKNGQLLERNSLPGINIFSKKDRSGIDVIVDPDIVNQSVHIPVILSEGGLDDLVYNTFEIGENSEVLIVAGCGIHNDSALQSKHDGIHEFYLRKGSKMRYVEKHYGEGEGTGERVLNPVTKIHIEEGATAELELVQIGGIDHTKRVTEVYIGERGRLVMNERLLTHKSQQAVSEVTVDLQGADSSGEVLSRSVAQEKSLQIFRISLIGRSRCKGHVACDSIIMDQADVRSQPELCAKNALAELTHEAAIGKLAGDQIIKLMTFGLSEEEAIRVLLDGYLK